jgi:hypothetical protein
MRQRLLPPLVFALLAACRADEPAPDPLAGILAREREKALAAARIGKAGGEVAVTTGRYQGVRFTVPPGALAADAVISLYGTGDVDAASGFRSVGPSVVVMGYGGELVRDALVEVPFVPEAITGPAAKSVVILHATPESLAPLAGIFVDEEAELVRGPTRAFGGFGAAVDAQYARPITYGVVQSRCPRQVGWSSLQSAIPGTKFLAVSSLGDAELYSALAVTADGCGYSSLWVVTWYSVSGARLEAYEFGGAGVNGPISSATLACAAVPFTAKTDSTLLADDYFARTGATPAALQIELVNCDATANPPRFVVTDPATGKFVEYDAAGAFVTQNF